MVTKADISLIRSLADKKARAEHGVFVVEGPKLVGEALSSGFVVRRVIGLAGFDGFGAYEVVGRRELERMSALKTPQGILAIIEIPRRDGCYGISPRERGLETSRRKGGLETPRREDNLETFSRERGLETSHRKENLETSRREGVAGMPRCDGMIGISHADGATGLPHGMDNTGIPHDDDAGMLYQEGVADPLRGLVIALDGIQDPGNLGTIMRIADWFGISGIVCSETTADCYNPKAVQASMGAVFRIPVFYVPDLPAALGGYASRGTAVYGTFLEGENIYSADLGDPRSGIIVMGNEGNGITPQTARTVTRKLHIPPYPDAMPASESLNVAAATAVICSEFRRRTPK